MSQKENDLVLELSEFCCADCNSTAWEVQLGHRSDGKTYLVLTCANLDCVEQKKLALDPSEEETLIWAMFDITEQGYDRELSDSFEDKVIDPVGSGFLN